MARPHALGVALAALVSAGLVALPAAAARPPVGDHQLTTAHFDVHYNTNPANKDYMTETEAGDYASLAEQAYSFFRSWGYAPPVNDGDGLTDIFVTDLSTAGPGSSPEKSFGVFEGAGPGPSTGYIKIAPPAQLQTFATSESFSLAQEEQETIAANVFYMFEYAIWTPTAQSDLWLLEGLSQWAADNAIGLPSGTSVETLENPDIALTCRDSIPGNQMCDPDWTADGGWARWAFFDLLASKYGNTFPATVLANTGSGESATTALSNALAAKGSTLASVYIDYVNRLMSGTLGPTVLAAVRPPTYANVATGASAVATTTTVALVPVNHLSARYVTFQRGDGDGSHACYAASLTINVAIPSGTSSQPYFFWDVPGSSPQPLSISGSTASITVPWDTCDWGATRGWVSLPNASTNVDGSMFTVSYSMTVDITAPATASPPPAPTSIWGTTVPVPTTDVAPTIDVFGPELLKISANSRVIELLVESSGPGSLNASLGSVTLGTSALRAGNNNVRYTVPAGLIAGRRRSASAANVLTLTPMSSSGATTGQAVTRQVSIVATPKAKPKPKKAKKPKK